MLEPPAPPAPAPPPGPPAGREPPLPGLDNCVAATVADIGYLGDISIYKLRIRDGSQVRAAIANVGGRPERAAGFDDQVWLNWPAEATIVLTR